MGFEFVKGSDIAATAHDLRDCVKAAGIPYAEGNASLRALVERIPIDCIWEDAGERLLVTLYLLGDLDSIERVIAERHKQGQSIAVNVERFDEFAENFLRYIEHRK